MAAKFLNPWVLNFQKLGLELKCPLCLNFVNRPVLLPCNHVMCLSCIPDSTQCADCPVCNLQFVDQDLRHLPFLENMANIYKCLDTTFSANLIQNAHSDSGRLALPRTFTTSDMQLENGLTENRLEGKSRSVNRAENNSNVEQGRGRRDFRGVGPSSSVNPEARSVPNSPPSFGDAYDSPRQCSEHSSETSFIKRPKLGNDGSRMEKLKKSENTGFERDTDIKDAKRLKQLNYGQAENPSNSKLELQNVSEPITIKVPKSSAELLEDQAVCAFCHSSKISEVTGSMLHYSNEKLVLDHKPTLPNDIHVHRLCIDWSPEVYFADEKVKNLTKEVIRGSKLKCSKCGKKGAALGCYMKSCRRTYHVPCAKTLKCSWDEENFLLFCPSHSSVRFPKEKSTPAGAVANKLVMPAMVSCQNPNVSTLPDKERSWLFCGSVLSIEEKILLVKFGKMSNSSVSKFWDPNVTHVIAATDDSGACTRTLKVLMAILNGIWIVKVDWVKACIEAKSHVKEEPFEISLDNYGCRDSPKTGRLRASNNAPKLFAGLNFYFVGDFVPSYRKDLEDLVIVGGGTLIKSREELSGKSGDVAVEGQSAALIIYNLDPPEGCKLGEEVSMLWRRLSEAEEVATQSRSRVIGHTWLLESIAAYKLQPFV